MQYNLERGTLLYCGANGDVMFLARFHITINMPEEIVKRGIIKNDTKLFSTIDSLSYIFRKGTKIAFDTDGYVKIGIIVNTPMNYRFMKEKRSKIINPYGDTCFSFQKTGFLVSGNLVKGSGEIVDIKFTKDENKNNKLLSEDTYFYCGVNEWIEFLKGTYIMFHDNSKIVKYGVLSESTNLLINAGYAVGILGGTAFDLNKNGYVH